jgi:hypothetical protein
MQIWLADPLLGGAAQGGRHLIELFAAFALTALIGLERTIQGKVAGLRTQTIVGTSSALIMLISKYGFGDVLSAQTVELDPSLLQVCGQRNWHLTELDADPHDYERDQVGVTMTLSGSKIINAAQVLAGVERCLRGAAGRRRAGLTPELR